MSKHDTVKKPSQKITFLQKQIGTFSRDKTSGSQAKKKKKKTYYK